MGDDKTLAALEQLHNDIRELIRVIGANYEGVRSQNVQMKRLYLIVITAAFLLIFFYPWISSHLQPK